MDNFKLYKKMPHLGFIDINGDVFKELTIYTSDHFVKLVNEWENIRGIRQAEFTYPRNVAKWIADSIQNRFWKSPENGGLPADKHHLQEEIEGEMIKINRVMTVGRPGQKGFMISNLCRPDGIGGVEEFCTPDVMLLDGGLLKVLEEL